MPPRGRPKSVRKEVPSADEAAIDLSALAYAPTAKSPTKKSPTKKHKTESAGLLDGTQSNGKAPWEILLAIGSKSASDQGDTSSVASRFVCGCVCA